MNENSRVIVEGDATRPVISEDCEASDTGTGTNRLAQVFHKSIQKLSAAVAQARITGPANLTGESLGSLANALFFAERWAEAKRAYQEALEKSPGHELAAHWETQIRVCSYNIQTAPEVEVTDPRFASPNANNTSFPKPVADALNVARIQSFTKSTLMGRIRRALGRLGGFILDHAIALAIFMIRDRALFGSRDRPRHTNWYIQKKAFTELSIGRYTLADIISLLKLMKQRDALETHNLFDSYKNGARASLLPGGTKRPATAGIYRQTDGSWTDLRHPTAGAAY